jgi:hypothetical protein
MINRVLAQADDEMFGATSISKTYVANLIKQARVGEKSK